MIRLRPCEDHGLALAAIQIDGGTQSRATLNDQVVNDYAEAVKAGATFAPIIVFYDGKKHWLADGFHRFHAYQKAGKAKVAADVRQGTRRDAILHSVGANETHGLRRTRDDKRRAVLTLLNDAEWSKWTDRQIARRCRVSDKTVAKYRPAASADRPQIERKVQRGGTIYTQKVAKAAKSNAREALVNDEPSPEAGPQAEASHSQDTGVGTLADREGRHEGEAASVDLPTISRNIVAEFCTLWSEATQSEREEIRAIINSASDGGKEGRKRLQVAREPINAAEPDVLAATREGLSMERGIDQCVTAGETAPNPDPQPTSQATADKADDGTPASSAAPFAVMSKADQIRLLRPHCQHADDLEKCAGTGRTHCHACKKLAAESEAA